jgi:tRNA-specific 2-thiouridylase
MSRVVLAMSGGVDSSVAAHLLQREGHEVIGIFMRHGDAAEATCRADAESADTHSALPAVLSERRQGCCSAADADDAWRVAQQLNIPFYALDFAAEFDQIIDYFVSEYVAGRTPNPCIACNNWLKFGRLFDYADSVAADYVATGHHARLVRAGDADPQAAGQDGLPALLRGRDAGKDQAYVLFGVDRSRLPRMLLPVGKYPKEEIRRQAQTLGLTVADKRDSQEICFVTSGHYAQLVQTRRRKTDTTGEIVESSGRVVGRHEGIERFTVGQRKGLGVALGSRRFVVRIEADTRRVVIGDRSELAAKEVVARQANWLVDQTAEPRRCTAQIRYNSAAVPAVVQAAADGQVRIVFDRPCYGVAPGQAVVCFDGPRVLGGGWIDRWTPASATTSGPDPV